MAYIRIEAEVVGNIVVGATPLVANHIESSDYISGTVLRGAFARLWQREDIGSDRFLDLFCRGSVCFGGLFPAPSGSDGDSFFKKGGFPFRMPLSAYGCKYDAGTEVGGHGYLDAASDPYGLNECFSDGCRAPLKQLKNIPFYYMKGGKPHPIVVKKDIFIYHGTDRMSRRARDDSLYSYTSIVEGQRYLGWLTGRLDDLEVFWGGLKDCYGVEGGDGGFECRLRIGRAKKRRGFLRCRLDMVESDPWRKGTSHPLLCRDAAPDLVDNRIIIVLQTPAILYDSLFHNRTTLTVKTDGAFKKEKEFSMLITINGWSNVHGLPRKPDVALAAGSTFIFSVDNDVLTKKGVMLMKRLLTIQQRGIGERINEGYGQVLINPPFHRGEGGKWVL